MNTLKSLLLFFVFGFLAVAAPGCGSDGEAETDGDFYGGTDGDGTDGDGSNTDSRAGTCDMAVNISFCVGSDVCVCDDDLWTYYGCAAICATSGKLSYGCGRQSTGLEYCLCQDASDGDVLPSDGDKSDSDGDQAQTDGDDPDGDVTDGDVSDGDVTDGDVTDGDTTDGDEVDVDDLDHFSFFVTSLASIRALSGSQNGFGGDLRYGETGAGAGLRGADKICAAIAELSMEGATAKQWRAFLSATADENGQQVNAIDRIGNGPWYDRLGRLLAPTKADLLYDRPQNGNATIRDDFPNEFGVLNHRPDPTQPQVDNHDMLTGTNDQGRLYSSTATCKDWTSSSGSSSSGKPRVGHSWPRSMGPGGKPGGGDMENWMSALDESGCAPGVNLVETGGPGNDGTVGSGGGYGGFYCFALIP